MTEWVQTFSYFLTNGLRFIFGIYFVIKMKKVSPDRETSGLSASERQVIFPAFARAVHVSASVKPLYLSVFGRTLRLSALGSILLLFVLGGGLVTVLQAAGLPSIGVIAAELFMIAVLVWYHLREKLNVCLFLSFFYEVGVGLWDFLMQAGLGVLFQSDGFIDADRAKHLIGIWLVRILMAGAAVLSVRQHDSRHFEGDRFVSSIAILGLFGAVTLSQQTILPMDEDQVGSWIILSLILLFAVMFYRVNKQREMETEIARLKQDQAEILEREYQALSRTYADNAKLYHDLHNHIETIYQCLVRGDDRVALEYCEELRAPVREISQTVWTGDKAIDYLISSKMALAGQAHIRTKVNVEYPRNTNIRSVDLTTILGNLLDNAIEAAETAPDHLRFLNLIVRRINAMLVIKVENGYGKAPTKEKGEFVTSKTDKAFHGWGMKSILTAAQRYDGAVNTEHADGIFTSVVTLSFQPIQI